MKYRLIFFVCVMSHLSSTQAQNVGISDAAIVPHPAAILELQSAERGFLIPRMTTSERNAINSPAEALMIYNTDDQCLEIFVYGWHQLWCDGLTFNCPPTVTDVDGNVYPVVQIGGHCWMASNLKTTRYNDLSVIPNLTVNTDWANTTSGAYCWHNNNVVNKDVYGGLYNWYAVETGKLCPQGWHVPTDAEWTVLTNFIGSAAGIKLKSCRTENHPLGGACNVTDPPYWMFHATNYGTDDYSFSGIPGGSRNNSGVFPTSTLGPFYRGNWWSSTEHSTDYAFFRYLFHSYDNVTSPPGGYYKKGGYSVRCIKN